MKKSGIHIVLLAIFPLLLFSACNDDEGYSQSKQWEALATVYPTSETAYYLVLDDGATLGVSDSGVNYRPKANQRVYVNFTLLNNTGNYDYYAKINWISEILTKSVVNLIPENEDSIGNDPVKIHSLWLGDNYLNVYFGFNSGNQKTHFINLVNNTAIVRPDSSKIYLEFRHNANGDPEWYPSNGFVAFDLRPYKAAWQELQDSIDLVIDVKDFNNEHKTYTRTYKFGTAESHALTYGSTNDATLFR
ncbi:MAG: NigD-like protein [Prevotella sp.]|jgi:hypothetical protein|nr:NigD-like protein [Prevotella sp.]